MKIKMWDRLILWAGSLLAIAAGVVLFVQGLQVKNALHAVLAVMLAAFGGYMIVFLRRHSAQRQEFVIQRTDSGELRIAVKAIENQVQKCIDLHEEILDSSLKIVSGREGVVVELIVTLANNISIPLAVASLQKQIKQYLVASSGIEVKEVRVSVESTQDSFAPEPQEQDGEQCGEKACAKEKKAPLHQRLFGRPEEPAIVPEPPKDELEEEYGADEEAATEAETEEALEVEEAKANPIPIPVEQTQEAPAEEPVMDTSAASAGPETSGEAVPLFVPAEEELIPREESAVSLDMSPNEPETAAQEREETPEPLPESDNIPESEEEANE